MKDKITFKENYWNKLQYLNGKLHGEQLRYFSNGKLRYKEYYINGIKHGEQLGYWNNGQLYFKEQYLNGYKHGEQLSYYAHGEQLSKRYYINGEMVSHEEWNRFNYVEVNSPHFNLL